MEITTDMEQEYRKFDRAFEVITSNNSYTENKYIVLADSYADAENVYWNEIHGYYKILSIRVIEATGVGYSKKGGEE